MAPVSYTRLVVTIRGALPCLLALMGSMFNIEWIGFASNREAKTISPSTSSSIAESNRSPFLIVAIARLPLTPSGE